ncbi:MAG: hypothetical protein M9928_12350 [Anaerolineae bacterium]|nr:hypothetical protein [Anaerolineae bacterium]
MAGGDGSLGLVAGLPRHMMCRLSAFLPVRAIILPRYGPDRADPSKHWASFTCHEVRVDYALVGERVFVNNISLGLYARRAKTGVPRQQTLGTIAGMMSDRSQAFDLHF